jgi:hypothetical protein
LPAPIKQIIANVRANVVAYLALFLALSTSGAYAATQLGRNSVGTPQLKKNAVVSGKVRDGSLHARDFAPDAIPTAIQGTNGPRGLEDPPGGRGPEGPTGAAGTPGGDGAQGPEGVGIATIFGDGSDGDIVIHTDTELSEDAYFDNLTLDPGVTLNPAGFRIFVAGTLTLGEGSAIARDGFSGSASEGGGGLGAGTLGGSGSGGGGGGGASGEGVTNSLGGGGGDGAGGASGGNVTLPSEVAGGAGVFRTALGVLSGRNLDGVRIRGGAGGGSTSGGGGGGSGGGVLIVAARQIELDGSSAEIIARGGDGFGGGGGGGVVVVLTSGSQPLGLTLSTAGGIGGPGSQDGSAGFTAWLR